MSDDLLGAAHSTTRAKFFTTSRDYLQEDSLGIEDGSVRLQFLARSNHTYSVLGRDSPADGPWLPLTNPSALPSNHIYTISNPQPSVGAQFYLLVTPQQQADELIGY